MMAEDELIIVMEFISTLAKLSVSSKEEMSLLSPFVDDLIDFPNKYLKSKKVAIVGLNPSEESPDLSAFHPNTRSGKAVRSWFKEGSYVVKFTNLTHHKNSSPQKPLNKELKLPLSVRTFDELGFKIVTCGTVADTILRNNGIEHFAMPHPSGLNRFWNDKEAGEAKIKEMLEWIKLN